MKHVILSFMSCPNCNNPMREAILDNQHILHCGNCGSSFFEENGINRITLDSALKLSADKTSDEVSGAEKKCPKDGTTLSPIPHKENIPPDVTLLKCPTCRGIFVFSDDLLNFKKAQGIKIDFLKAWGIPLPTLKAVLVLTFIAVIGAAFVSSLNIMQQRLQTASQAQGLLKKVYTSSSGRYLFLSFSTQTPVRSKIIFKDITNNTQVTKTVADKPTTLHYLTTTDINLDHEVRYQIILIDERGKEIKTEEKRLEIK